jgi:hypothetical protein
MAASVREKNVHSSPWRSKAPSILATVSSSLKTTQTTESSQRSQSEALGLPPDPSELKRQLVVTKTSDPAQTHRTQDP